MYVFPVTSITSGPRPAAAYQPQSARAFRTQHASLLLSPGRQPHHHRAHCCPPPVRGQRLCRYATAALFWRDRGRLTVARYRHLQRTLKADKIDTLRPRAASFEPRRLVAAAASSTEPNRELVNPCEPDNEQRPQCSDILSCDSFNNFYAPLWGGK